MNKFVNKLLKSWRGFDEVQKQAIYVSVWLMAVLIVIGIFGHKLK